MQPLLMLIELMCELLYPARSTAKNSTNRTDKKRSRTSGSSKLNQENFGQVDIGFASSSPSLTFASADKGLVSSLASSVQIPFARSVFPAAE